MRLSEVRSNEPFCARERVVEILLRRIVLVNLHIRESESTPVNAIELKVKVNTLLWFVLLIVFPGSLLSVNREREIFYVRFCEKSKHRVTNDFEWSSTSYVHQGNWKWKQVWIKKLNTGRPLCSPRNWKRPVLLFCQTAARPLRTIWLSAVDGQP